ncbi:Hypothetical predicted protein, partial [Pelobates cultripes]
PGTKRLLGPSDRNYWASCMQQRLAATWRPGLWAPHKDRIAEAFDHFWAQLWAKLAERAQTPAATD